MRACTDLQDWPGAKANLEELEKIAGKLGTIPIRADLSFALGYAALAQGKADEARHCFEDACDLYTRSSAPFETARARVQLGRALSALGRTDAAVEQLNLGKALLSDLHAELEVARAEKVLADLRLRQTANIPATTRAKSGELSKRELEVLRLVAQGMSNQSIAEQLFVSDHTVHRHLANILNKLDVSNRAAAVARAAHRGLLP